MALEYADGSQAVLNAGVSNSYHAGSYELTASPGDVPNSVAASRPTITVPCWS